MIKIIKTKGSAIQKATYNTVNKTLGIQFAGGKITYIYFDVPNEVVIDFENADSQGKFFHKNIRDQFKK